MRGGEELVVSPPALLHFWSGIIMSRLESERWGGSHANKRRPQTRRTCSLKTHNSCSMILKAVAWLLSKQHRNEHRNGYYFKMDSNRHAVGWLTGQSYRCRLDMMRTQTRHASPSHVRLLSSKKGGSPENARRLMESLSLKYEMIKLMFETK